MWKIPCIDSEAPSAIPQHAYIVPAPDNSAATFSLVRWSP